MYFQIRRVSFADPIYQAGLADDIDRRCSVVRSHSSNSSPIIKSVKTSPTSHSKVSCGLQNMHMSLFKVVFGDQETVFFALDIYCFFMEKAKANQSAKYHR